MTVLIGVRSDVRKACGAEHLPGCYNPASRDTYCICGQRRWPGEVGTWHSRALYELKQGEALRPESVIVGWDVYFLHATGCPDRDGEPHICTPAPRPVAATQTVLDIGEASA